MDKAKKLEAIKRFPEVARAYRRLYPHHSTCGICGLPWSVADPHHVGLGSGIGCFAVCEHCWSKVRGVSQLWQPHIDAYVSVVKGMTEKEGELFMEQRPLEYVILCVEEDYRANHEK